MNANAMPKVESPSTISPVRLLYWSVRRELWENRALYLAPLAVAALILVASAIGSIHLPVKLHGTALDAAQQQELIEQPYTFAALLLMFTTFVVAVFCCVDTLQSVRRDRSILFWKSLPVSDLTTVMAKASIPLVVLPLLTFAITVATQAVMLVIGSLRMMGSDVNLWSHVSFFSMAVMLLYHLVAVHALWWAPFYGWLLLVSAWARRAAFLWATLPPLAIGLLERIAFSTSHFANLLAHRFLGGPQADAPQGDPMSMAALTPASPIQFLMSPGLWIGLAFFAACLAAAVRLRRSREPN